MCSAEPLNCAIAALGHERIMFGADYPFEKAEEAGHWLDNEKLDEKVRADIAYNMRETTRCGRTEVGLLVARWLRR